MEIKLNAKQDTYMQTYPDRYAIISAVLSMSEDIIIQFNIFINYGTF